jgi:hypothetical protein
VISLMATSARDDMRMIWSALARRQRFRTEGRADVLHREGDVQIVVVR